MKNRNNVGCCLMKKFIGGDGWKFNGFGRELDSVTIFYAVGGRDETLDTSIVFHRWTDTPTVFAMECPTIALLR